MVAAIGTSFSGYSAAASAKPSAGLELDLQKYKGELADWCQCSSASTPKGKAKIQELTAKVNEIEARITAIANNRSISQTAPSANSKNVGAVKPDSIHASLGSVIDVLA
jgi:hypothetical protein